MLLGSKKQIAITDIESKPSNPKLSNLRAIRTQKRKVEASLRP